MTNEKAIETLIDIGVDLCTNCKTDWCKNDGVDGCEEIEALNMAVKALRNGVTVNQYGKNCTNITNLGTLNL